MDRLDFIREVFKFCHIKDEDNSQLRIYDRALSTPKKIDWDKLFDYYIEKAEKRTLPAPKFFLDLMPACIKREIHEVENDGNHIRVIFDSGRYTDFVICGFGMTLAQIKEKSLKNDNVKEVRMYPKEVQDGNNIITVALIGDYVYPNGTPYEVIYAKA